MHKDGEIDVRATYCVVTVSLLLGIATPELFAGVGDAVARCQTYEGGLAASAYERGSAPPSLGEAHGGYTYCAIACHLALSLLPATSPGPSVFAEPAAGAAGTAASSSGRQWSVDNSAASSKLDLDAALRWAVWQQGTAVEGGGMRGRTNKLVDGCYGWFSGGGLFTCLGGLMTLRADNDEQWWADATTDDETREAGSVDSNNGGGGGGGGTSDGWESLDEDEDGGSASLSLSSQKC